MKPKVAVVIINWNGKDLLDMCIPTVLKQSYKNLKTILVDNGSEDGSVEHVKKKYKKVKVIELDKNYGFSIANNKGFEEAMKDKKIKYIAILNNDTKAHKNWISEMVKVLEEDKKLGSAACKILRMDNPKIIDSAGMVIYNNGMPSARGTYENKKKYEKQEPVFGAPGAAALYRREMLEDIEMSGDYFDADFFMYQEEFDLSWRAQIFGWKCMYVPKAEILHMGSATTMKISNFAKYHLERNRYWALTKNLHKGLAWYSVPHVLFYEIVTIPFYIFRGQFFTVLKARVHAMMGLRKMFKKRKKISKKIKITPQEMRDWMVERDYIKDFKQN